jgi:hypothetical protein
MGCTGSPNEGGAGVVTALSCANPNSAVGSGDNPELPKRADRLSTAKRADGQYGAEVSPDLISTNSKGSTSFELAGVKGLWMNQ